MTRRTPLLVRAGRALVGLLTLWCLGCSSYEPVLGSLLGAHAGAMMGCDTEMGGGAASASMSADGRTGAAVSSVSAPDADHGVECGCGSCYAPSPNHAIVSPVHASVPAVVATQPTEPASVSRAPLLPPPERAA